MCGETAVRIKDDRRTKERERILITRAKRGYIGNVGAHCKNGQVENYRAD